MGTLRLPDWTDPLGTGLWGLGYRLHDTRSLVLLSNGPTAPGGNPDRLWPFILRHDRRRDAPAERSLAGREEFRPLIEHQPLGKEVLLCVREKDLAGLLSLLEETRL
jgi:hypothetical protein